ncbi:hypothetical protein AB1E18_006897 [Capra hircus]
MQSNPYLPPTRKYRNIRKHQVEMKGRSQSRKKRESLKACRDCLEELEGTRHLVSLLQSHLGRLPDKSSFHQFSRQDLLDEVCKAVPAGAHQPCGKTPLSQALVIHIVPFQPCPGGRQLQKPCISQPHQSTSPRKSTFPTTQQGPHYGSAPQTDK